MPPKTIFLREKYILQSLREKIIYYKLDFDAIVFLRAEITGDICTVSTGISVQGNPFEFSERHGTPGNYCTWSGMLPKGTTIRWRIHGPSGAGIIYQILALEVQK